MIRPGLSVMAVLILLCLNVRCAYGDVIGGPGFVPPDGSSGGIFVGTYLGVVGLPNGVDNYTVAQLVPSYYDYSDLTLTVQLMGTLGTSVDFSLAPNDKGNPGAPIATESIQVTNASLTKYTVGFGDSTLQAGTWYWLIASSPDIQQFSEGGLPIWVISPGYDYPNVLSQNGGEWLNGGESFAYELDGTAIDQNYREVGPIPIPVTVPHIPEAAGFSVVVCDFSLIAAAFVFLQKSRIA